MCSWYGPTAASVCLLASMEIKVTDKRFLKAVSEVIDEPGTDVAVVYLAEIAPGILLARETDGEVVVYVNLKTYK
jgi:hypothetical protein